MNSTQPLNIDQMLSNLSTIEQNNKIESQNMEEVQSSIPKETPPLGIQDTIVQQTINSPVSKTKDSFHHIMTKISTLPNSVRIIASSVGTLVVFLIGIRVISVQYPQETESFLGGITGTFSTVS